LRLPQALRADASEIKSPDPVNFKSFLQKKSLTSGISALRSGFDERQREEGP
jgi:hypothetical protein